MTLPTVAQVVLFLILVTLLVKPVGSYMAAVFAGEKTFLDPILRPVERGIMRVTGLDPQQEMTGRRYALSFVLLGLVSTLVLYVLLRLQVFFPWYDHTHLTTPVTPDLALNTAVSFATTTTWQAYAGETTMSYFSQVVGLVVQNFVAGASGLAVGIAFIRGFSRERTGLLGNFWVDVIRAVLWILLPLSILGSLFLIWQGVPMNFHPYIQAHTVEGGTQVIAQGPVAALEFIKNLGTNGGGFFNANGAHPYENPTPLTNFVEMLAIVVLPASLTHTFGRMVGRPRQGWTLFSVMLFLFVMSIGLYTWAEQSGNPHVAALGMTQNVPDWALSQPGGNMEGKEVRFGIGGSALTTIVTSNGATGSYNAQQDSATPLGGMVPIVNMLLGEIVFGGLGTGLYSMIMVALVGVFIAGLMIGRTPEYLGKKLDPPQMKLIMLYTLVTPLGVLLLTALAVITPAGLAGMTTNTGAHGFSEILTAYTTSLANNGLNFAGLSANTFFYNVTTTLAMLLGRFGLAIPALALATSFAQQPKRLATVGTLPTDTVLFASVIIGVALLVGALTFLPALALGPIVEQVQLFSH